MINTTKNQYRISVKQVAQERGLDVYELLEESGYDSIVPACCKEGCEVEPDGTCEHGCPSILLSLGVI